MVTHIALLGISRLILGCSGGLMNIVIGKMIFETIPAHLASTFSMAHNASVCIGFVVVFGLGAILPD